MLQLRETRIVISQPHDVLTGHVIPEEGIALSYVKEGAVTKVKVATGEAGEVFAGVSYSRNVPPSVLPVFLQGFVPSDFSFELTRNPIPGQLLVKIDDTIATIVDGAPEVGQVQIGNLELIFNPANVGSRLTVQMMYSPTLQEARSVIGDAPIGGLSSTTQGSIGVLKDAVVGTNMFDASVDWSAAMFVRLAAGGIFTTATDTNRIPNVIVKQSPDASNPFLVLSLNVA